VQTEYDIKLVEQRTRHVMKLAADRHRSAAENAKGMAEQLIAAVKDMEAGISRCVAGILAPFLADAVRRQAIEDLAATLSLMVKERRPASLKVEGPWDLLEALKGAAGGLPASDRIRGDPGRSPMTRREESR